jgi:carboxymethylenebutenolidase
MDIMDQRIVELYDEYTHKPLDRRVFMERLVALTGSAAAAQLALTGLASNYALAQTIPETDPRIAADRTEIGGLKVYRAAPKGVTPEAARAVVIVIHENRGLNPHIEDVARRIAAEGYLAIAVDMLTPMGGTPRDEDAARDMFPKLDMAKATQSLAAIVDTFKKASPTKKVGVVGFCWGGGMVNNLATAAPALDAGVVYYGAPPKDGIANIKAPLMMHYAGMDKRINDMAPAYEEALKNAGVSFQAFTYEGVNHAFNNDTGKDRYNEPAAKLAWGRTLAFLKEKLG